MIYLASPYWHVDPAIRFQRRYAACKATAELMKKGLIVYCPIAHNTAVASAGIKLPEGWDFWSKIDLHMLNLAEQLYVCTIPGWETSAGVAAEIHHATAIGIPICHYSPGVENV